MIFLILLPAVPGEDGRADDGARRLVDAVEALQLPVEDFRCEFEGSVRHMGEDAETQKLGEDGLYETFSGTFVWKRGGDTYCDTLRQAAGDNRILRETLVVRAREGQAELYERPNDAPLGYTVIKSPREVNSWRPTCPGWIFLIDRIKRERGDKRFDLSVRDDKVDG